MLFPVKSSEPAIITGLGGRIEEMACCGLIVSCICQKTISTLYETGSPGPKWVVMGTGVLATRRRGRSRHRSSRDHRHHHPRQGGIFDCMSEIWKRLRILKE